MEEIIRLTGYEVDYGQIKRKGIYLIFTILLLISLYGTAERYREGMGKTDRNGIVQSSPAASNLAGKENPGEEEILQVAEAVSLTNGIGDIDWWTDLEEVIPVENVGTTEPVSVEESIPGVPATEPSWVAETVAAVGETTPEQEAVPLQLTIHLHGNGGEPSVATVTASTDAVSPDGWNIPARPGKVFDGWYLDAGCTVPFTGVEEGISVLELYAGWREFEGFVSNDVGHIISCTDAGVITDGILALPSDAACTGIEAGALSSVAGQITEIYIPANIGYIGAGAFEGMPNLMYIEAAAGNPNYYSAGGVLYTSSGEIVACPVWYVDEAIE